MPTSDMFGWNVLIGPDGKLIANTKSEERMAEDIDVTELVRDVIQAERTRACRIVLTHEDDDWIGAKMLAQAIAYEIWDGWDGEEEWMTDDS